MREICIFVKTFERIFILYMWKNIYCVFHKVPCYYGIEVQFVIIVNMQHHENAMILSFSKHVTLKRRDYTTKLQRKEMYAY